MRKLIYVLLLLMLSEGSIQVSAQTAKFVQKNARKKMIYPGQVWNDQHGNIINAHGGGFLYHDQTYYWFGEIKSGLTWKVPGSNWENYRVAAGGVSCYSSKDLKTWKYLGVALKPSLTDSTSDLYTGNVIERPKVVFNALTKKFVMWLHIDSKDYAAAKAGVAVSDKVEGPYQYIGSERPGGNMARDMTLFQDDDGKCYHFYSSEDNTTMHVCLLSNDYLSHTSQDKRIFVGLSREAPAVFKFKGKYYIITSACTGWAANAAGYARADSILGPWKVMLNPCKGPGADSTFNAQSTFVLPVNAKQGKFIFMADRWKKTQLPDSRYIWLPLTMRSGKPEILWLDSWDMTSVLN